MLSKSPSGALSPYYYKGGYFHGIRYGSYFNDMESLRDMISQEEAFILRSPEKRRILMDLYETKLTAPMILEFVQHIGRISPRIIRLAIAGEMKNIKPIYKSIIKGSVLSKGQIYLCTDMEEGKTWLVSDSM